MPGMCQQCVSGVVFIIGGHVHVSRPCNPSVYVMDMRDVTVHCDVLRVYC